MKTPYYQLPVRKQNPQWEAWELGRVNTIFFMLTRACQLRCKYCYIHEKNIPQHMDFDIVKRSVDYIIKDRDFFSMPSGIFYLFGGEVFLNIDLLDQVSGYITRRLEEEHHPWAKSFKLKISTNGLLYSSEKAQHYIKKYHQNLMISITIDGTKVKHDSQRIYADGKGSYEDTVKQIPLWLSQFPHANTKITVGRGDIPHIMESVLHIWSLGIRDVNIILAYENYWEEGDDVLLEEQLIKLADYIISHDLYKDHFCLFYNPMMGTPLTPDAKGCGTGRRMIAIDHKGGFYPCLRFLPSSMESKKPPREIGNCYDGIDKNKLRPFQALTLINYSPSQCCECDIATGCLSCLGQNYDEADTETMLQRLVFRCKMHKAHVRANEYYWKQLSRHLGKE